MHHSPIYCVSVFAWWDDDWWVGLDIGQTHLIHIIRKLSIYKNTERMSMLEILYAPFASWSYVSLNLSPSCLQKTVPITWKSTVLQERIKNWNHPNHYYPFCGWICCGSDFVRVQVYVPFQHLAEPYTLSSSYLYLLPTHPFSFLPPSKHTVRFWNRCYHT